MGPLCRRHKIWPSEELTYLVKIYPRTGQPCQERGPSTTRDFDLTGSLIPGSPCMRVSRSTIDAYDYAFPNAVHFHTTTMQYCKASQKHLIWFPPPSAFWIREVFWDGLGLFCLPESRKDRINQDNPNSTLLYSLRASENIYGKMSYGGSTTWEPHIWYSYNT